MKRKPIEVESIGCGCSVIYQTLPMNFIFDGCGVHMYTLRIDDRYIDIDQITLKEVFNKYKREFHLAECVEVSIMTPLHDETYELNNIDNKFLLVEQGIGYA